MSSDFAVESPTGFVSSRGADERSPALATGAGNKVGVAYQGVDPAGLTKIYLRTSPK